MVSEIANAYSIPQSFLSKITRTLRKHHLIKSTRGRNGGIRLAKSADSMLDFKIFVANYFQDLRRELDYYVSMEPDATSEIERIEDELYHETQI